MGHSGAQWESGGQAVAVPLPAQNIQTQLAQGRRASQPGSSGSIVRALQNEFEQEAYIRWCGGIGGVGRPVARHTTRRDTVAVRRALHANGTAQGVNGLQSHQISHRASTGIIADNDHHHERVTQLNGKTRLQMLETARIIVLISGLHGHRLIEGEFSFIDGLERRHHDGNLARACRGHHDVTMAVCCVATAQVFKVPARMKRQRIA